MPNFTESVVEEAALEWREGLYSQQAPQAAKPAYFFFAALNFAQRARAAAAILFLPAADIVRLARLDAMGITLCAFTLAHRARCARAILRREAAEAHYPDLPFVPLGIRQRDDCKG
jgi:hypothetical protein